MILSRMSWLHELEQDVPSGSLNKGRNYFRSGGVQIDLASADRVEATVKGGGRYSVAIYLNVEEDFVVASCTCPHYEAVHLCKHIWATVLAAESKGHLKRIADMEQPTIFTEIEFSEAGEDDEFGESDDEDEESEENEDFYAYAPPRREYRSERAVAKPPKVDAWKSQLRNLRAATPADIGARSEGKRRIIYVVDVALSISANSLVVQAAACRLKKDGQASRLFRKDRFEKSHCWIRRTKRCWRSFRARNWSTAMTHHTRRTPRARCIS